MSRATTTLFGRFAVRAAAVTGVLAAATAGQAGAPAAPPVPSLVPDVIVHLSDHQAVTRAEISIDSGYRVVRLDDRLPIAFGRSLARGFIEPAADGVRIGGVALKVPAVEVLPDESSTIVRLGSRPYRGALQILRDAQGRLSIRNRVSVDDYLYGVVGAEMPADFPPEALRAQAIVARTYALHGPEPLPGESDGPLTDSILSQVYGGVGAEDSRIERAVCDTRGLVLTCAGKLFTGYFHSTCGGATSDVFLVFGRPPAPPLHGVACGFCADAPFARWSATIPRAELERAAATLGCPGNLVRLEIAGGDPAGRATRLAITVSAACGGDGGVRTRTKEVSAADFRLAVGPASLRSSFLTGLTPLNDGSVRFEGRGFGHGVGLCQMGARAMAARGFSAEAILLHYFPGAEIRKIYG